MVFNFVIQFLSSFSVVFYLKIDTDLTRKKRAMFPCVCSEKHGPSSHRVDTSLLFQFRQTSNARQQTEDTG